MQIYTDNTHLLRVPQTKERGLHIKHEGKDIVLPTHVFTEISSRHCFAKSIVFTEISSKTLSRWRFWPSLDLFGPLRYLSNLVKILSRKCRYNCSLILMANISKFQYWINHKWWMNWFAIVLTVLVSSASFAIPNLSILIKVRFEDQMI